MPRTAKTPVKGNAYNCERDDTGTKKKTIQLKKETMK